MLEKCLLLVNIGLNNIVWCRILPLGLLQIKIRKIKCVNGRCIMRTLSTCLIFFVCSSVYGQSNINAVKWEGSKKAHAYLELSSGYHEVMAHAGKNSLKLKFDGKTSTYMIFNLSSKKYIYLASKNSIYDRKLSGTELKNLMAFSSTCVETHVEISFHESSPNGAKVYLDNSKIGDDIKDGKFRYTTMGVCREAKLNVEILKENCLTHQIPYVVPTSGDALMSEAINLECPKS